MVTLVATVATVGVVWAASLHNVTSPLGGTAGDYFELDGTLIADSIKVGEQGVGGVTFFNGTIINTTTTSTTDNPVTFGDNVRIDGRVWRGATSGTTDTMPFIINDNAQVLGDLTVDGTLTLPVSATYAKTDEVETITANWVNTANPWAADEIANVTRRVGLPLTSFLTDADATPAAITGATVPNLAYATNQGSFLVYSATETTDIGTSFTVPADYSGDGVFKAIVDLSGSIVADADLDFTAAISQTTGTAAWDTDMDNETPVNIASTPGAPQTLMLTPTDQANFSAGDTVFLDLFPANYAGGEPDIEIYSVWFEYTAVQ